MYVLVLCLASAAVALPTPENLHTNLPNLPAPPELPSDVKEEHDAQVPVQKPLTDPISHEENDAKVSVPKPLVDHISHEENDAKVSKPEPLVEPISDEKHDAQVSVTKPLTDPIPDSQNDVKVPVPIPIVDLEKEHDEKNPVHKPLVDPIPHGDHDAKKPIPEPLVYPIPFDSQEIWQDLDDIFGPEESGEYIPLDSEEIQELIAIEQIYGPEEADKYEEQLIASNLAKQFEKAEEAGKKQKKDSKSEELQKNKDSEETKVPNKPGLVEFDDDVEPLGLLSWFQNLVPLLYNRPHNLQNLGRPFSGVGNDKVESIYIIELQPEYRRH